MCEGPTFRGGKRTRKWEICKSSCRAGVESREAGVPLSFRSYHFEIAVIIRAEWVV